MEPGETAKRRDEEIESYDVIGRPPAHDLQALADLAAQLADAPGAAIVLVTSNQEHRVAAVGSLPAVPGPSDVAAFSVPLVSASGLDVGRLCIDVDPGRLSDRRRAAIEALAEQVVRVLELRSRTRRFDDLAAELTEARDDLKRSHEHLSLFAGQVSHDLRTPLTAILANAEMLAGEPAVSAAPDIAWMLDGITRAAHRLDTMIEQILAYAAQGGEPQRTDTDLNAVFGSVLTDLAPAIDDCGASVAVDPLPQVQADRHQLYAVALNLVSNAVRFAAPEVRPEIRISSERYDDRWRISVTDNGIGIPEEQREAMFVLFARADKRSGGSGIGLAATRRIVEAHGGRVGIDGAAGGGTTVWFDLPA